MGGLRVKSEEAGLSKKKNPGTGATSAEQRARQPRATKNLGD